jgi:hypothetical protein
VPIKNPSAAVDDSCGVFVAKSLASEDTNPGTKDKPVASLKRAIELALEKPEAPRVYACAETLEEAVEVPPGLVIYGGLDCENGWPWVGDTTRTTLTAAAGVIPLKMTADTRQGSLRIEDFHVVAKSIPDDGTAAPGTSSIAAVADRVGLVDLVRCILQAGDAAAGADGEEYTEPAAPGAEGNPGGEACSDYPVAGGAAQVNDCGTPDDENDDSIGGSGGNGDVSGGGTGNSGFPLILMNGRMGEAGATSCGDGAPGDNGEDGEIGMDAQGTGTISRDGYTGVPGSNGGRGKPAQGGGGGGGARGVPATGVVSRQCPDNARPRGGAGGGSGGSGGCGGAGGRGGGPGGSSIALISLTSTLRFEAVTLKTGRGGNGGTGGQGQAGGMGGPGGKGGGTPTTAVELNRACNGGPGGIGGKGGTGGAGLGGHSLGITFQGTTPATEGVTPELGEPGSGGIGAVTQAF